MENNIQTLRVEVANSAVSVYGAMRRYAEALCETLPADWFYVERSDKGEREEKVHQEKKALFAELKKVGHSNPSTIWARVRQYGHEHVYGSQTEEGETAEGEGSKEDGPGARHTRSLKLRFIEELTTLYKAGKREEAIADDVNRALTFVSSALAELGVDLTSVEA